MDQILTVPNRADFEANLAEVRETVCRAAATVGRRSEEITIGAVTKTFSRAAAEMALEAGLTTLCENRVQEAAEKFSGFELAQKGGQLHLIGHLQTNKAVRAVAVADSIDSVDSLRLARLISKTAADLGKMMPVLVEVNIGDDPAKSGVAYAEIDALCEQIALLPSLSLQGLMTILPLGCSHEEKLKYFSKLFTKYVDMRDQKGYTGFRQLSMGMSGDYAEAVMCGATTLRIGTALFGKRERR